MKYYLLRYADNWADEMDLEGYVVLDEEEHAAFQQKLNALDGFTFVVGTNEDIEYDSKEDLEAVIDIEEITEADVDVLEKLDLLSVGFAGDLMDQLYWDDDSMFNFIEGEDEYQ